MAVLSAPGPGVTVRVDGTNRTTPYTAYLEPSGSHDLFVPSPQNLPNRQYVFKHWEDGSTNQTRTIVLGDSAGTYAYTAFFDVFSEVSVTVTSNPVGKRVTVDGVDYESPAALIWEKGTPHTIGVPAPILETEGSRLRFDHWSDGGEVTHVVTAPSAATTYTAFLTLQHHVTVEAQPGGRVDAVPEWQDEGSVVPLQAHPDSRFEFDGWVGSGSGSYTGPDNPATATVLGPISETAQFRPTTFELSFSLSDTDPFVNSGAPIGIGPIHFWAICAGAQGISSIDIDLDIQDLDILGFVPSPGFVYTFDGSRLSIASAKCLSPPEVLGAFYVNDLGEENLPGYDRQPGGSASPRIFDCTFGAPLAFQGLQYTRVHGCRTDGGQACVAGNGCAEPPAPALLSLTASVTDRSAEIYWTTADEAKSDGFHVDRSTANGSFERVTLNVGPRIDDALSRPRFLPELNTPIVFLWSCRAPKARSERSTF